MQENLAHVGISQQYRYYVEWWNISLLLLWSSKSYYEQIEAYSW